MSQKHVICRMLCGALLLALLLPGCRQQDQLRIAVAANLLLPMQEVLAGYAAQTGKAVELSSASSGTLTAQIRNGAPFHLFFSADMKYPEAVAAAGLGQSAPEVVVRGRLVFWEKAGGEGPAPPIDSLLRQAQGRSIAIAQPELAPYGRLTQDWLKTHGLWEAVEAKLVYGENISQVNQYITSASVDLAFTAVSAMNAPGLRELGRWRIVADAGSIPHGLILMRDAPAEAQALLDYLLGPEAQAVFARYGYLPP